jgi:acyl-CoA reductase-like NAD-dependent aldehyde dehydrogenase
MTEAGIPEGVYNVVTGYGPEAGSALASHPDINHLSFTGSVETGIEVMQHAARNVVPLTLELGGKSPNIVFADADIDSALEGAFKAMFANAGQVCCAGSRLLLEEEIYDSFTEQLLERVQKIQLGPGTENPDMGPLISNTQRERVLEYIRIGGQEGAELLIGGGIPENSACKNGFFVEPTLIGNVENQMTVAQDEIFGPVLSIIRFHDEDEAIHLANESQYGLVAGVWTSSLSRAHKMAAAIEAGQIYINDFFSGSVACPFGGYKKSGFGRERGLEALEHYTQVKNVCIKLEK